MIEIGEKAIGFCIPNQDEVEVCLRDLAGKWIVLYFYPKDNTPGCTTQACDFTTSIEDFENLDAVVIGVSPDSPKKHRSFIEKKNLKIMLLSDENKEMLENYGVWQLKKFMGKEYMGVVRTTYLISPDSTIAYRWDKVKVKTHIEDVRNKLTEIKGK